MKAYHWEEALGKKIWAKHRAVLKEHFPNINCKEQPRMCLWQSWEWTSTATLLTVIVSQVVCEWAQPEKVKLKTKDSAFNGVTRILLPKRSHCQTAVSWQGALIY